MSSVAAPSDKWVLEYMEAGLLREPETEIQCEQIKEYLRSLDAQERIAITIARDHLKTSFNIVRSNGYNAWIKTQLPSASVPPR
jgi:hypothetical protein